MDTLPLMLASVRLVGWALVHFLWQGALLGLIYWMGRAVLPRGEARYRFGMATLIVLAICPLLTVWRLLRTASPTIESLPSVALATLANPEPATAAPWVLDSVLNAILPWLVLVWSLGVLFLSLRAWRQWRTVTILVRAAESVPMWQSMVTTMARRFGLRRHVRVLCSKIIATPVLVGWIRPVILLPMAVVCNFPAAQIELIFAHELAHLRRWDPLANLFQVVLETLHFYHPVVHWISRDVRNEREICCDAMALSVNGGSRYEFVAALAELGELSKRHGSLLLAAKGGILLDRVQQIVLQRPEQPARAGMSARFVAVLIGALLVATTLRLEWSQAQLQRNLTESLEQLTATLAPHWLPLAQPIEVMHWSDLVPAHVNVMRPAVIESPPAAADSTWLPIGGQEAIALPRLSPATLRIPDMPRADRELHLPIADQTSVSDASATPTPIRIRQPVYPEGALIHGIEGKVMVEFGIAADGSVQDLYVISAKPAGTFDQAALQAMRGWKYDTGAGVSPQRRYRQTLAFTLSTARPDGVRSSTSVGDGIQAQAGCQVSTGTHICRWPDNSSSASTGIAISSVNGK